MTEDEKRRRLEAIHKSMGMKINTETDNRIGYESIDIQSLEEKLLFQMAKDNFNGQGVMSNRDDKCNLNLIIAKNAMLKKTYSLQALNEGKSVGKSIQGQIKSMSQRNVECSNEQETGNDGETCPKELVETSSLDHGFEKIDAEKEVQYEKFDQTKWSYGDDDDDDDDDEMISLKEEMEESEKINKNCATYFSDDSQYMSAASSDFERMPSQDEEDLVSDLPLIDEYEPSEKLLNSVSSFFAIESFEYDESGQFQCISYGLEQQSEITDNHSLEAENDSFLGFESYLLEKEMNSYNQLSSGAFCEVLLKSLCMDMNIMNASLQSIVTSSFNGFFEDKVFQEKANILFNIDFVKDTTKKSPSSMDNRHGTSYGADSGSGKSDLAGSSILTQSAKKPRARSGSSNKSRGRRQRSKKQGNNNGDQRNGGSGDGGNGANSSGRGGSSGNGQGNGGDRKKDKHTEKCSDEEDEEDEEDESDEDNKKDGDEKEEKEVGAVGNLSGTTTAQEKAVDKDLTKLLSQPPPQSHQSSNSEGILQWQVERESLSVASLLHEQEETGEESMDHSHISLDDVCDILSAASGEDYEPRDDILLPLNTCLTTLAHNMSLDPSNCSHCCLLSTLLQHVAKCEASLPCRACMQGYNMMLHHAKICMETNRPCFPLNRMDLCFKLCQNVRWNSEDLFGSKKEYNKMMIKKQCIKTLTMPLDHEATTIDLFARDDGDELSDESRKCDQATAVGKAVAKPSTGLGQGTLRPSGSHFHHQSLSRKPSDSRRSIIPPSITEEEDEEKEKDEKESKNGKGEDDSVEAILRRRHEAQTTETAAAIRERNYIYSLPQGRINDQTQFNSLVVEAKGVKGVGEVVYSNVAQLRLLANFWGQKKEEFKSSRRLCYQRAEEGVILEKYRKQFFILGTRYQMDYQWYKLSPLGQGMTGRCYLARDSETGFQFCVKKIHLMDYKKEELCLWSDLNHPNVVKLYGALRHSEFVYLLAEYVDGGDLAHCIDDHKSRGERVSHWLALKYFQQLLIALVHLELKNVLHEDIKADNLLLRADDFQIVITDFGLCHRLQKAVELKNKFPAGTATHFSPEKAASMGHGFPACVWACVCVLVHMLSGQQPWSKYLKKVDCLNFCIYMKPPPLDDVPDNIRAVVKDLILQGFTKDPEKRPTARQLLKHEAFDIINQETETYFSTLAIQSNVGIASRNQRDRGIAVRDSAEPQGSQENQEQEVSLYEISVQPHAGQNSGIDESKQNNNETSPGEKTNNEEEQGEGGNDELLGAVGGVEAPRANIPLILNQLSGSSEIQEAPKGTIDANRINDEVQELADGRIPHLEQLLQTSSEGESVVSFLTDNTSAIRNVQERNHLTLYNPTSNPTSNSSDMLPNLSMFHTFNPFAWEKQLSGSSEVLNSDELYAPGKESDNPQGKEFTPEKESEKESENPQGKEFTPEKESENPQGKEFAPEKESENPQGKEFAPEDAPTHFKEKKPAGLRINMNYGTTYFTRSSASTANTATASSQGSSVSYPGSARANAGDDFKDFGQNQDTEKNKKVSEAIAMLRESIDESNFDGTPLTLYDEQGNKLFRYLVVDEHREKRVHEHVSFFKAKITIKHFELKMRDGGSIDYQSRLNVSELMVVAQSVTEQCWCLGCQC